MPQTYLYTLRGMDEKQYPTFEQMHDALGPDIMSWMHDMVSPDKTPPGGRSVGAKPMKGKQRKPISFAPPSQSLTPFSPSENAPEAQGDLQPPASCTVTRTQSKK